MTSLRVTPDIFTRFPEAVVGVVIGRDLDNRGEPPDIMSSLRQEEARLRTRFAEADLSRHPHIAAWRDAYRAFGAKPKDYPSSIENHVRRISKGHSLSHINKLVDLYNTVSLRYLIPVGGEDLDAIRGDVVLTFAAEDEAPVRLLGEAEDRRPRPGEVIYRDDLGAICRRWNWKEADRTKLTETTRNAVLVIEGLPPVGSALVQLALDDLAGLVTTYCGGTVATGSLDVTQPHIGLSADLRISGQME